VLFILNLWSVGITRLKADKRRRQNGNGTDDIKSKGKEQKRSEKKRIR
jgi:hypothetical protein